MTGETLPGLSRDPGERIVCHVDMDCFYASCERLRESALRGEPVVVGMGYEAGEPHGAVATASYEAREYGVESAQPISQALDALPRAERDPDEVSDSEDEPVGYYRPVDMDYYQSIAAEVREILHDVADVVREVSIDEAYLDVTDRTAWDRTDDGERTLAEGFARHVKGRIDREVGVPASVGVAPNMSTAKIASDAEKPDGLVVVPPGEVESFLAPLSVEEIHGVGPVTARRLRALGVEVAGDLAAADPATLESEFGSRGRELYDRARGHDDRAVTPRGKPKSLNREKALTEATSDQERKRELVRALASDVADRARSRDALYRTIGIKVVTPPYDVNTRERSLPGPIDDPDLVREEALDLLGEFADDDVRKLGVRVSNLSFSATDQSKLDGWDGSGTTNRGSAEGSGAPVAGPSDGQAALSDFDSPESEGGTDPSIREVRGDDPTTTLAAFDDQSASGDGTDSTDETDSTDVAEATNSADSNDPIDTADATDATWFDHEDP